MSRIAAVIEELVLATVMNGKVLLPPPKTGIYWQLMGIALLLAGVAFFLLVLALERFFENLYPPDIAALATAGVVIGLAGVVAIAAYFIRRQQMAVAETRKRQMGNNIQTLVSDIFTELDEPVRENPKTAMAVAALAGFLANREMH
jgi:hypothetical protein